MRWDRKRTLSQLSIFLISLWVLSASFFSEPLVVKAAYTTPTIEISTLEMSPGQEGLAAISGWNIPQPGLAGFELSVLYDPQKLEINSLEKSSEDSFAFLAANFNDPGIVKIAGIRYPGVSGDLVLTHLHIKAKEGVTGSTDLKLEIKDLTLANAPSKGSSSTDFTDLNAQIMNGKIIFTGNNGQGQVEGQKPSPLTVSIPNLLQATVGEAYHFTMQAKDGTPPYTWAATGLPEGLTINSQTGEISGTPSVYAESQLVQITVTDSGAPVQNVSLEIALEVQKKSSSPSSSSSNSGILTPNPTSASSSSSSPQVVLAGQDRYLTALKIAMGHFVKQGPKNVLVANGYAPADALAGAPLAYQLKAPILLGTPQASDAKALHDFLRLTHTDGGQVVLLGSTGVLDDSYGKAFPLMTEQRLGGQNRRETAVQIARKLNELKKSQGNTNDHTVVIVNENAFVDAISIAPFAAQEGWPILLTEGDKLSPETAQYLDEEKPSAIIVIGSTGVVNEDVWDALESKTANPAALNRLGGSNRFETNALVLDWAKGRHPERFTKDKVHVAFANGDADDVIDALAGASLGIPIVLVHNKSELSNQQLEFLKGIGPAPSEIFGSSGVIAQRISWNQ